MACDGSPQSDAIADLAALLGRITHTPVTLMTAVATPRERETAAEDLRLKAGRMRVDGVD